jgi:hypothetical protein
LLEVGLLRGSFIPPDDIRQIRDLTRYQTKLTEERSQEKQRLLKVLEAAGRGSSGVGDQDVEVLKGGRRFLDEGLALPLP